MDKINFRWSAIYGEYSLFFFKQSKEYEYRTYNASFAKDIIRLANKKPGSAWNKTKLKLIPN